MLRYISILFLIFSQILFAQFERPGSAAAQFLKIDVSPRGAGLAGAYIALAEGAEAAFYNPAVLGDMRGTNIVFNHNEWFADINHEFVAIAHNFGAWGSFALSVNGIYTDEMLVRTPLQPDGTGETFYAGSYQFGISYARGLTRQVTLGGSVKLLNISLFDDFNESALTLDISANYNTGFRGHRFAFGIFNFGQSVKFVNEEYPMPTLFVFGMSINGIEAEDYVVTISGAAQKPNDGPPLGQAGVEAKFMDALFIRGGYYLGHDVARYAFGVGADTGLSGNFKVRFDYAYTDFSALGGSHRFGLGISF